jgi:hypothetical protein
MTTPNSAQGYREERARAISGKALDYNGDWHAVFDTAAIPPGDTSGRMLAWINLKLGTTYKEVNGAMYAFAAANGAATWGGMGTFT